MNAPTLHSALLEMLIEIDRICQKHQIAYQLAAGTLLGAVRHQQIIPWDKDADICMLRTDYERFMAVAEDELDDRFFLQHHRSEPLMYSLVTKLRLQGSRRFAPGQSGASGMHEGIAVDIFAFDTVHPESLAGKLHMRLSAWFKPLLLVRYIGDGHGLWRLRRPWWLKLMAWLAYQPLRFPSKRQLMQGFYRLVTWYSATTEADPTGYVSCLVSMPLAPKRYMRRIRRRADFVQLTHATLSGHRFPVPVNFHEVLTNLYGDYRLLPPATEQVIDMVVEFDDSTASIDKPHQS